MIIVLQYLFPILCRSISFLLLCPIQSLKFEHRPIMIVVAWLSFKLLAILFVSMFLIVGHVISDGVRTGNWTTFTCNDPAMSGLARLLPQERWVMLDCDHAWSDAIHLWKTVDSVSNNLSFSQSIANTFHVNELSRCEALIADSNCDTTVECTDAVGQGSGPAGYEVYNSMIMIHEMYYNYNVALSSVTGILAFGDQNFQNDFAPVPTPSGSSSLDILLDLIGVGALMAAAPFFNSCRSRSTRPRKILYAKCSCKISPACRTS